MIARVEPWGAWVRLTSPPAIVALTRRKALALGIDGGARWSDRDAPPSPPVELHVSLTSRCPVGCDHCYADATMSGAEPSLGEIERRIDAAEAAGVLTLAFGGGEPLTRGDLGAIAAHAARRGIASVLTTSGVGLSDRVAQTLRGFHQVNVSFDEVHANAVRKGAARSVAERAIATLVSAGVRVGVNVVLTRESLARLGARLRRARELGASEAQLLRYKPAGRARSPEYLSRRLSGAQTRRLGATVRRLARALGGSLPLRIDCALVPLLSTSAPWDDARALAAAGVLGCEAGAYLSAVSTDGRLAPCSFLPAGDTRLEAPAGEWARDPTLARAREHSSRAPEPCATCPVASVCRGGCRVVAGALGAADAPDPECTRVLAYRGAR